MITVIARLTVREGREQELVRLLSELAEQVRANEPQCVLYQLCKGQTPGQLVVVERYASPQALAAHRETDHFRASAARIGPLLQGPPAIEVLNELA